MDLPKTYSPRLAVRALIVKDARLLLVNAYARGSDLWCAPGGGVERGQSLPDNLIREVQEETGLEIAVGPLAIVSEFHDPSGDFHQVDLFYHAQIMAGALAENWRDPEGIVHQRRFFSEGDLAQLRVKPDALARAAFGPRGAVIYDPLEPIQKP
ncbi:MAG: 8-oxo-dGTP pyrophosphatase MutT (NUDIX family) [Halocynthiibacter sp.]|jgi:8-oxo-dGTP diphosphatase